MNRKLDARRVALFGPPEEVRAKLVRIALGELVPELVSDDNGARDVVEDAHFRRLAGSLVTLHPLAIHPFAALVRAWRTAGVLGKVHGFDKFFAVADDGKRWGAHAWGNAFDVNTQWNELRSHGQTRGDYGSTHELEEVARPLGWVCGRQWLIGRAPRHFELLSLPPAYGAGV